MPTYNNEYIVDVKAYLQNTFDQLQKQNVDIKNLHEGL